VLGDKHGSKLDVLLRGGGRLKIMMDLNFKILKKKTKVNFSTK
jgi:hypothetical protein